MRRVTLILLGLTLLAPASARAQSSDETSCRSATGLHATCVGLVKLGERVSAECRRADVPEEQCWSRIGRRVIRAEIDAYDKSWTHRTLSFQQQLGDGLPLREAPWVGTHNSYNSTSENPTLSHTDSNQQLSLGDQLRLGVRSLELDVHWIPSLRAGGASVPVLCHGRGADELHGGCTTERLLSERLVEVAGWVRDNPGQVLLLYIEDHLGSDGAYAAAARDLRTAFGDFLYRPAGPGCTELPLHVTRRDILDSGARVIVVGDCGTGEWPGISHSWPGSVRVEERPRDYRPDPECGPPSRADYDAKLVRYYEDSTFVAPAAEATGLSSTDDGLTPETVGHMVRCGVDLFGFDQILPRDGRLDALVWSWASGEPSTGDCTIQRSDGRWEARPCRQRHRPACVSGNGSWRVLAKPRRRRWAVGACKRAGMRLGTPRTGYRNKLLRDAVGDGSVWLAYMAARRKRSA